MGGMYVVGVDGRYVVVVEDTGGPLNLGGAVGLKPEPSDPTGGPDGTKGPVA